ncbi:MAG TPA: glycosyltransferase, partial [Acidimicrobiales bacterium]
MVGATLAAGPASTSAAAPPDDQAPAPSAHGSVTPPSEPPVGAVSTGGADRNPAAGPGGPGTAASAGLAGLALVSLGLTGIAAAGVRRTLHTWRGAGAAAAIEYATPDGPPTASFSLVVPARGAGGRLGPTLDRLAALDHPRVEVLAVVPTDDPEGLRTVWEAADRHPGRVRVVVDRSPGAAGTAGAAGDLAAALEAALTACRGDVVGLFQPGDRPRAGLLRHVDATLAATGASALQGGVRLGGGANRWAGLHHALDRYLWFHSRIHVDARQGFVPLAPSTAFVRADVGRRLGAPDGGCDAGMRLALAGEPVAAADDPALATGVDGPATVAAVARAEAAGFAELVRTARRGDWRRLPTRGQRLRARWALARPLVDAVLGAALPLAAGAVVAVGAPVPVLVAALVPLAPVAVGLAVDAAALAELGRTSGQPARLPDQLRLLASALPYRALRAGAALAALRPSPTSARTPSPATAPAAGGEPGGSAAAAGAADGEGASGAADGAGEAVGRATSGAADGAGEAVGRATSGAADGAGEA